jgi:WD40 repeat protein
LWRARKIAVGCVLLTIAALGSAIFGYRNMQRAQRAQAGEVAARASAQAEELAARQRAYGADMNVAMQAFRGNNLGQAIDLLNRQRPEPGQTDLRGWEWRYLWEQTRSDAVATIYEGGRGEITSVAVSRDGRWLAAGLLHGGGVHVWDLQSRQEVAVHEIGGYVVRADFSPTGPLLAFAAERVDTKDKSRPPGMVHVWNAETRQMVWESPLTEACVGLSFTGDGKRLIMSSAHELTVREAASGNILQHYPGDQYALAPATGFAVNAEGTMAAYGTTQDGIVRIVDLRDGHERRSFTASKQFITALAFSPDGQTLATAAGFGESDIRLWDMTTDSEVGRLVGHAAWVGSIVFWPDGKKIASASADQTIRIWDVPSRKTIDVLRGNRDEVWRLALLPDEKTLVSGGKDGTVNLWDASRKHLHSEHIAVPGKNEAWRFSKDSASVITVDQQGEVARWSGRDWSVKEHLMHVNNGDFAAVRTEAFTVMFTDDAQFLVVSDQGVVKLWNVLEGAMVSRFPLADPAERVVAISRDHARVHTYSPNEELEREWDVTTQRAIQSWDSPPASSGGALSPDEMSSMVLGKGGAAYLRDLKRQVTSTPHLDVLEASDVAYSRDGRWMAAASQLSYVKIWSAADWKEMATLRGFRIGTHSVAFSPDARRLAVGAGFSDEALTIWDTTSFQRVLTLSAEGSVFRNLQYSPDGNAIGVRNSDRQLFVWRAPAWEEISAAERAVTKPAPVNLKAAEVEPAHKRF